MAVCTTFRTESDTLAAPPATCDRGLDFRPDLAGWSAQRDAAALARRAARVCGTSPADHGAPVRRCTRPQARRLLVGVGALVMATLLWSLGGWLNGPGVGVAPVGADLTEAAVPFVVVEQGDTLWSIAADLDSDGDVRELVDRLAERNGGTALQVGQRLVVGE